MVRSVGHEPIFQATVYQKRNFAYQACTWDVYPLSHDAPAFALHGVDLTRGHTADLSPVWTAMGGNCRSSCEPAPSSVFEIGALGCPKLLRGNASLDDQK